MFTNTYTTAAERKRTQREEEKSYQNHKKEVVSHDLNNFPSDY